MTEDTRPLRFLLNGESVALDAAAPTRTVLDFLREEKGLPGTKEGCAEGDCGACTVVVGELAGDELRLRTVNACIHFLPMLDGKALFTVEYLKGADGSLHPVQQAMVERHGSQCGFCTPGFVMSLWERYVRHAAEGSRPGSRELATHLAGNLCRCTGYRPILEAGQRMFELPPRALDEGPIIEALRRIRPERPLAIGDGAGRFHAPRRLEELLALRAELPEATVLAGCTDVGLWVTKQLRDLDDLLYVGEVAELGAIERRDGRLAIGAAVPLEDAYAAIVRHYPVLEEMWERFASVPIRNAGTLGGNLANGSPIGDSAPWLIALGAEVVVHGKAGGRRSLPLEAFYLDYMKKDLRADEIVESVLVPLPAEGRVFRAYKLSKRYDSDISAVCAAFSLSFDGERIAGARVAYGGMAATVRRAWACEAALAGRPWDEATARGAMASLGDDFAPIDDMRASAAYRARTAANLLYRFYLETRPERPLGEAEVTVFAHAREMTA